MNDYNGNNYNNYDQNGGQHPDGTGYDRSNAYGRYGSYSYNEQNSGDRSGFYYSQPEYNGSSVNEFSYTPSRPRKTIGRKILTGLLAVAGVAAISVTSIVGYNLVMGEGGGGTIDRDGSVAPSETIKKPDKPTTIDRGNLPTLEQLAAPEDALSIPQVIEKMSPSVVGISCITSGGIATGSGIILSEDGYIITNAHVIDGAQSMSVVLPVYYSEGDDDEAQAKLTVEAERVGSDDQTDIAVLKIDRKDLVKADIGVSSDVQVGELSIVIGNPLGLDLANSATAGIISAKDRTITIEDRTMKVLQTDASINFGNSGGPLINAYGQVIGITSAKVASNSADGLGFAIPIDDALPIIDDLMKNGYVTGRPSLSITGTSVTSSYASYYGIPQGFMVVKVTEGGCSEKAGIQKNDIIIAINDTIVTNLNELNDVKNKFSPGDTVTLTVYRNGKKLEIDVVLDEATGDMSASQDTNNGSYDRRESYDYFDPYDYWGGF